jgi:hypothetical protein
LGDIDQFCSIVRLLRVDVFTVVCHSIVQLGIVVYDVLVGEPPFTSNDEEELTHRITHEKPQFPDDISDTAMDFILAVSIVSALGLHHALMLSLRLLQ